MANEPLTIASLLKRPIINFEQEAIRYLDDTNALFSAFPPPIPLTRRQRIGIALSETRRRIRDAWRVIRHGETLGDW